MSFYEILGDKSGMAARRKDGATMEDHIAVGSWRRTAAGVGVVVLGCACVATASLGGSRPGTLAEAGASAGGSVVDMAAGPSSGGRSQRGWGFSDAVINDFDHVLQGHIASATKDAPKRAKKTAPSEESYLLRMGLVQHRGGSLIGGVGDTTGAGTLVSAEEKANAAARLQKLSFALKKNRGGRMVGQVNIGQASGAGKLEEERAGADAEEKGVAGERAGGAAEQGKGVAETGVDGARTQSLVNAYHFSEGIPQHGLALPHSQTVVDSQTTGVPRS